MNLETKISSCDFSTRAQYALNNANIHTIGKLCELTHTEVLRLKNVGRKTYNEINEMLEANDYCLAGSAQVVSIGKLSLKQALKKIRLTKISFENTKKLYELKEHDLCRINLILSELKLLSESLTNGE